MAKATNRHERYVKRLAELMDRIYEPLGTQLRGGPNPPFVVKLPRAEQLRTYYLLARPIATLTSEEAEEADWIWQQQFQNADRASLGLWAMDMEKLRKRVVGGIPEPMDWGEEEPAPEPFAFGAPEPEPILDGVAG